MQAGIDEAGRGPVVGPLVVGLVAAEDPVRVAALGVKDSKLLTARRRQELDASIRAIAERVETVAVAADELDRRMERQNLNEIELALFSEVARRTPASTYYLDACDPDASRFGGRFLASLARDPAPRVVSEHRADANWPLVSAASIVAKVARDAAIASIAARLEPMVGLPLGSGYSHDAQTRAFLSRHLERFGRLPPETRLRWATARDLTQARWQRPLPTP